MLIRMGLRLLRQLMSMELQAEVKEGKDHLNPKSSQKVELKENNLSVIENQKRKLSKSLSQELSNI